MTVIFMETKMCIRDRDDVMGANIAGFEKVADAMLAQGIC